MVAEPVDFLATSFVWLQTDSGTTTEQGANPCDDLTTLGVFLTQNRNYRLILVNRCLRNRLRGGSVTATTITG